MQWLDIRLQLMGAAVVSAIAGIALVQHQQGLANPGTTPGTFTHLRSMRCPCPAPDFPCAVPQRFHLPRRVPVSMCRNSPAPYCRVEDTESQEVTFPGDAGSGTRTSLLVSAPALLPPSPALCQAHPSTLSASADPLHCLASSVLWPWVCCWHLPASLRPPFDACSPQLEILPFSLRPPHQASPSAWCSSPARTGGPVSVVCPVPDGAALGPGEQLHADRNHAGERRAAGGVLL